MRHRDLLVRAGYGVRGTEHGDQAAQVFAEPKPVDVIVLDFALSGRPPEAVLLFSRRTSSAASLIGLVPSQDADAFRRAFLAGARDVLPSPARGEDLLAAVDLVMEPRALEAVIDRMRLQLGSADETIPLPPAPGVHGVRITRLEDDVAKLTKKLSLQKRKHAEEMTGLRQQALDAVTERDRLIDSRNQVREKLAISRKEMRETATQLRMMERAAEELQRKLKSARDQRRSFESRLSQAKTRIDTLERSLHEHVEAAEREVQSQVEEEFTEVSAPPPAIDPEEALLARAEDEQRLQELEDAMGERARLAERVRDLEAQLLGSTAATPLDTTSAEGDALEDALAERAQDEERLAELESAIEQKRGLEDEVARLRKMLKGTGEQDLSELDELREAHEQTLGILDAVRLDRDTLKRRVSELERESADALMRVEELQPLTAEVERLRADLRAEREALLGARQKAGRAATRVGQLDRTSAVLEDELAASQRALILTRARAEVMNGELADVRAALVQARASRNEALEQVREAEAELDSLRVTVATLAADRAASRSRR
jgi:DNA-binding NarL/FixJ family response regulator/outer membrane murein-binding lipoprotein Lpp